jgi:hypothetical protein
MVTSFYCCQSLREVYWLWVMSENGRTDHFADHSLIMSVRTELGLLTGHGIKVETGFLSLSVSGFLAPKGSPWPFLRLRSAFRRHQWRNCTLH